MFEGVWKQGSEVFSDGQILVDDFGVVVLVKALCSHPSSLVDGRGPSQALVDG